MRTFRKILIFSLSILTVSVLCLFAYTLTMTRSAKLSQEKLQKNVNVVQFLASDGTKLHNDELYVPLSEMPTYLPQAFIAVEDKRFYSHNGIDYKRILGATARNLLSFSLKEGASTITQQLIKNTHLTGEKTFKRKLIEAKLARKLEKTHSKEYILECYLNTIYFGNGAYGVGQAARQYFNKEVKDLTLEESATLAAIIKAPAYYAPTASIENSMKRRNVVLKLMEEQNYISHQDYKTTISRPLQTTTNKKQTIYDYYLKLASQELEEIKQIKNPKTGNLIVKTYLDTNLQNSLVNADDLPNGIDLISQIAIDNKTGGVVCYKANTNEILRAPGSTLKPLLVYAPCIERDIIAPSTLLLDEKTNFNGYSPSNYKNEYHGYISAKFALSHSLNVPSVKLLQYLGIDNAVLYAKMLNIPTKKEDHTLALALGVLTDGISLRRLTSAYTVFSNDGNYLQTAFIQEITDENGKILYSHKPQKHQIFSKETVYLMNEMTRETIQSGTMKRLSDKKKYLYGKSGTVGTAQGNSDAYAITYTKEYTLGVWVGAERGSMLGEVTGGGYPTIYSNLFWEKVYQKEPPTQLLKPNGIVSKIIDKYEYETNHKLLLANNLTPKNEQMIENFKKSFVPNEYSTRQISPNLKNAKISVNTDGILILLCQTYYFDYTLFRSDGTQKIAIYSGKEPRYLDTHVKIGTTYQYSVLPYASLPNGEKQYGKETIVGKIKYDLQNHLPPSAWWEDYF